MQDSHIQLLHVLIISLGWPHNYPLYGSHFQVFSWELLILSMFSRQEAWTKDLPVLPSRWHESDAVLCGEDKKWMQQVRHSYLCLKDASRSKGIWSHVRLKSIFIWFSLHLSFDLLFICLFVLPGQPCPQGILCWTGPSSVLKYIRSSGVSVVWPHSKTSLVLKLIGRWLLSTGALPYSASWFSY